MKVDRTKYTAHYENGMIVAQWISVEMAVDGENGECPLKALDRSKELVDQWHKANNPGIPDSSMPPGPPPVISVQRTSEDTRIAELVKSIYACRQLDGENGLYTYSKLSSAYALAQLAYDVMEKKLRLNGEDAAKSNK